MSSVLPIGLVSDDGIEDGKQFAHDGGQGDFLWFAEFEEVVIAALEDLSLPKTSSKCQRMRQMVGIGFREGQEVLEVLATKRRDRKAALEFLKQVLKRHGQPATIVTDRLQSYRAAMKDIGVEDRQLCG